MNLFDLVVVAAGSVLRPFLSTAAQAGLQSMPADVETYIERLKREQGL